MTASLTILCLSIISYLSASLFEPLDKDVASNAAECAKLTLAHCGQVKACMVDSSADPVCVPDPCFERLVRSSSSCKTDITGVTCVHVPKPGSTTDNTSYCVSSGRETGYTDDLVCNLEWGEYRVVEYGLCKVAGTGCGKLEKIEDSGKGYSYYLCTKGSEPNDPCNPFQEADCPYIKECLWADGTCIIDDCWERTMTSADNCRDGCDYHVLNPGEGTTTPKTGYCKSKDHDLASPCNALSQTVISTGVCSTLPPLPDDLNCTSYATVTGFESSTLYVCNPEKKDISAAVSLKSFVVAFFAVILLILM